MKFHILIYGCQMNYADSARVATILKNIGFEQVKSIEDADIVIFDTCSVRQKSEDKITWKLREIAKNKKIRITWCMIWHNMSKSRIKENQEIDKNWNIWIKKGNFIWNLSDIKNEDIPFIINEVYQPLRSRLKQKFDNLELFFRIDDVHLLPKIVQYLGYYVNSKKIEQLSSYVDLLPNVANQTENENIKTAYVPISTWCNQFCSYCIVPFARWFEKNRKVEEIINEVDYWTWKWKEEIVLIWQIVNKHPQFYEILQKVLKNKKVKRLRYTSPYPTYYSDEIFQLHEQEERLCPHIHIPVQSGSNKILKLMNRWYKIEQFKEFIDKIRNLKREISITTDIIVWFTDENEEDFQESVELARYSNFDMIYVWIYSPRPNTKAWKNLQDNVPRTVKKQRRNTLNDTLYEISLQNNKKEIWKIRQAMIVGKKNETRYGYTDNMKNIELNNFDEKKIWKITNIKVQDAISLKLFGTDVL